MVSFLLSKVKRIEIEEHMTNATQQHLMMLLGMNLHLKTKNELLEKRIENSNERIHTLEEFVQQKDEQIKNLTSFSIGIATIQNRVVKEKLAEPQVGLLENDEWKRNNKELKWRKFVNQHLQEERNYDSKFTKRLKRSIADYNGSFKSFFDYTLKRMIPNNFYSGKKGEFFKVNVSSYIHTIDVIYTSSFPEYLKKDPTMGLRSSCDFIVSYSEDDCLHIVLRDWFQDSYLVCDSGWGNKLKLQRKELLEFRKYSKYVHNNYIMVYCEYS